MCGIFAYIGAKTEVAMMTHQGLCDLEYRGYDSWGIAADTADGFFIRKSVGKISEVDVRTFKGIEGTAAIGHSRWATHGAVSEANAHPHFNSEKTIAVVHNGIIENHSALKQFLIRESALSPHELFTSETDTEVIPHLIDHFIRRQGLSFEDAFVETARMLEGRYAFVAMRQGERTILGVRDGSPLVLGKGVGGFFFASDVPAFLDHTRMVNYIEDRQYVRAGLGEFIVRDLDTGKKVDAALTEVVWEKEEATKEGYPHFMLKEILEQGSSLDRAIRQEDSVLTEVARMIKANRTFFLGCGTAFKMAKMGELYASLIGRTLGHSFVGSEFRPYEAYLDKKTLLFAVSQSGETADVLETLGIAKKKGAKIAALLNVVGSSMDRMADRSIFLNAGPEIAVASTKAATAQMAILLLLAHALGGKLGEGKHELRNAVKEIKSWLSTDLSHEIAQIAKKIVHENDMYLIGRGLHAPIAEEAAIKIQEVSYIHAQGFPGGELKHGPIALVRRGTPVIAFVPHDETRADMESNAAELRARGAIVIGISPEPSKVFDEWVRIPSLGFATPIASIIPIQLLAYHLAILRGNDPDRPRNLAKSVTVK